MASLSAVSRGWFQLSVSTAQYAANLLLHALRNLRSMSNLVVIIYIGSILLKKHLELLFLKSLFNKNKQNIKKRFTFISVCHNDARHELLLTVGPEGVSDHNLILCQLALQIKGIKPVELNLRCQRRKE